MSDDLVTLASAEAIRAVVTRILHAVDGRRWDAIPPLLEAEVTTDYRSLFGGDVQRQPGAALAEGWRTALTPLAATQHVLGPIDVVVRGSTAVAECHVRAHHLAPGVPGGEEWMVAGHYVFEVASTGGVWRVGKLTLLTYYQTGNTRLLEEAGRRAG